MLIIAVRLRVEPGRHDDFLEAMLPNATASNRDEPGCLRFDVCTSRDDPGAVLLYEAYQDDAAFEAHLASPHYLAWQAGRSDLVVDGSQVVERFDLVESEPDR